MGVSDEIWVVWILNRFRYRLYLIDFVPIQKRIRSKAPFFLKVYGFIFSTEYKSPLPVEHLPVNLVFSY